MRYLTRLGAGLTMSFAVVCLGCGGGSSPSNGSNGGNTATVAVSPGTASVALGATQQFTSTPSSGVTWSVNGGGTISASGLYTAPADLPSPATATVTATSGTTSGTAAVTLTDSIQVSVVTNPAGETSAAAGTSINLVATVANAGSADTALTWTVNDTAGGSAALGTVTANSATTATYTAPTTLPIPAQVTIAAVSKADATRMGSLTLTLTASASGWTELTQTGTLPTVMTGNSFGYAASYDAGTQRLILFGGWYNGSSQNTTWTLSNAAGTGSAAWTQVTTGGTAPAVNRASVVLDSAHESMIVFDGCESGCTPISGGQEVLTNANGNGTAAWTSLAPTGTAPGLRQGAAAGYDATDNRMIIFGGQDGSCCPNIGAYSDIWVLTNANGQGGTPAWISLAPTGGPPLGINAPAGGYDATDNRFVTFGGVQGTSNPGIATNAVWAMTNANAISGSPAWVSVAANLATGAPPLNTGSSVPTGVAAVYDPVGNNFFVVDYDPVSGQWQIWQLTFADGVGGTPAWSQTSYTSGPSVAASIGVTSAWYDSTLGRLGVIVAPSTGDYQVWTAAVPNPGQ